MRITPFWEDVPARLAGMDREAKVHLALWIAVPFGLWGISLLLMLVWPSLFMDLTAEDGPIENTQVVLLVAAGLVSAWIATTLWRRGDKGWGLLYAVGAIGLWFIAGEEISWGQRLLGIETPETLAANLQGEANLHNLPGVMSTVLVPFWMAVGLATVLSLLRLAWPRMERWRPALWVPPAKLIPAWLCMLSYGGIRWLDMWWFQIDYVHSLPSRLQEPAELILYGGVLAFVLLVRIRIREGLA